MEYLMAGLFENVEKSDRTSLHARYRRRAMVDYIHILIEGYRIGQKVDEQKVVRDVIVCILRYHEESRNKNNGVCMMGKYHDILYIAVKICYDKQLKDTETVAALLDEIYACEGAFDRIFVGAIYGCSAPFLFAGWKSDFKNQEENIAAVLFYLDHATNASCEYNQIRFIDTPIEACLQMTPLKSAIDLGLPDLTLVLLRFGALIYPKVMKHPEDERDALMTILNKLEQFDKTFPYNFINCLQFLLRAVPRIRLEDVNQGHSTFDQLWLRYPRLMETNIVPLSRIGVNAPELKHLCRCEVRKRLWMNYQLPYGIKCLPVPETLQSYLDLVED